jgi:hypothetical protein
MNSESSGIPSFAHMRLAYKKEEGERSINPISEFAWDEIGLKERFCSSTSSLSRTLVPIISTDPKYIRKMH